MPAECKKGDRLRWRIEPIREKVDLIRKPELVNEHATRVAHLLLAKRGILADGADLLVDFDS